MSATPVIASWYSSVFSADALPSRVPRMASVVAPQVNAAPRPSASPIHWRGPAAGVVKPSANAQATPANAISKPTT